jgi:hypothetical protein
MAGWFPLTLFGAQGFFPFKLGAGGQTTNISIASDGTKVARTDTGVAFYYNSTAANPGNAGGIGCWQNIVTQQSIPGSISGTTTGTWDGTINFDGVYEIVVCPSNTNRFYLFAFHNVLRSDNRGATWVTTGFTPVVAGGNVFTKFFGPYMAVDPNNADIVYVGTPASGVFVSTNAGTSFSPVSSVGAGVVYSALGTSTSSNTISTGSNLTFVTQAGLGLNQGNIQIYETSNPANWVMATSLVSYTGTSLVINPTTSGGSGTHTDWTLATGFQGGGNIIAFDGSATIYISTYGTGVFKSINSGASFTQISSVSTSGPINHQHMVVDQNHNLWLVDNTSNEAGALWKYNGTTWTSVAAAGSSLSTVLVDPANASNVTAGNAGGGLNLSKDGGVTWTGLPGGTIRVANDIPWLTVNESFMTNGNMAYDPSVSNTVWFAEGIGVWTTNPPATGNAITWTSHSAGIEDLVSLWVISPPGGQPAFFVEDRGVYRGAGGIFPSGYGPNYNQNLINGSSGDWASSSPGTLVVLAYSGTNWQSSKSIDGGVTWTVFSGTPSDVASGVQAGGMMAASTPSNIMYIGGNNGNPYYTTDGGATWNLVTIAGISSGDGYSSFSGALFNRQTLCSDRVDANTFYLYNSGTGAPGIYISTNSGVSWTQKKSGLFIAGEVNANAWLKSVPGNSGHLFYSGGIQVGASHPTTAAFYRSTDHGATWSTITNMNDVWAFGFGAPKPGGGGYPSIYVYGWYTGSIGVWRSIDNAATWQSIGDGFPGGSFSQVRCVEGDNNTYGYVYLGTGGQGFFYGYVP